RRQAVFILIAVFDQVRRIVTPEASGASPGCGGSAGGCGCGPGDPRAVARAVLGHLYAGGPTGKPELDGFAAVARTYNIPGEPFHSAVDALLQHAGRKRYATWGSFFDHCRRFAGAFAALALPILAPDASATAHTQAHSLAAAMYATTLLLRSG